MNMKKILNSALSLVFIFVMIFSNFAALPVKVSAEDEAFVQENMFFGAQEESNTEVVVNNNNTESAGDLTTDLSVADQTSGAAEQTETISTEEVNSNVNFSTSETEQRSSQENLFSTSSSGADNNQSLLSIDKFVKNVTDSTDYSKQVDANFDEIVRFKLVITNIGTANLSDLYVSDTLPEKLSYVDGSLSVPEPVYGGNIFSTQGLNVHDLNPGQSITITFDAKVSGSSSFGFGETILTNNASSVEIGGTPASPDTDSASVRVFKQQETTPPPVNVCNEIKDKTGWYGKYYDYNSSHPNMEEVTSTWNTYYGDPLSNDVAWTADWYDSKYFKLGRVDSNLIFNNNFFPLDSVSGAEIINGHNYHFGVHWKAVVTASSSANYGFRIDSDDDAWVYVDGDLIKDNRGVHPVLSKTGSVYLTKGDHIVDIFFAERHTTHSNMYFKFNDTSLVIKPFVDGCTSVNTPPVITLIGNNPLFLTVGDIFVDPGATSTDAQDGDLTSSIVKTGTVNTSAVSTTTLTYSVTDSGGLSASTTRLVVVKPKVTPPGNGGGSTNTPPVITLIGNNPLNIFIGSTFVDPGATATDAQDGNLTSSIIVSGTVATSTLGTSTLTYSVYDSGGLGATTTREVVVLATTTPPVVKPQCSDGLDNDGDGKIDSLDPGCHSDGNVENGSSFDPNDDSEVDVPSNPPSDGGGNGGGGGGGSSLSGRRRDVSNLFASGGEILGASSCSYLRDYLRIDWANDRVEVLKLQSFLNIYDGAKLNMTGVFDQNTLVAVNNFQNKYESDILTPWGHDAPTGFVYILTKKKINEIYCNTTYPLTSEQAEEIREFRSFLDGLKSSNPGATYDAGGIGGDLEGAIKGVVVLDQNGEVVDTATTSVVDLVKDDSFSSSVLRNAAVSIFAVPDSTTETLRCLIAFLIILLVMYIVSGILANGTRERRIVFLILSVIAIIVSIIINFYCVVAPLLLALIISALLIIFDNKNGDSGDSNLEQPKNTNSSEVEDKAPENLPAQTDLPTKEEASSVIEMPGEIVVENDEEEVIEPSTIDSEKTNN